MWLNRSFTHQGSFQIFCGGQRIIFNAYVWHLREHLSIWFMGGIWLKASLFQLWARNVANTIKMCKKCGIRQFSWTPLIVAAIFAQWCRFSPKLNFGTEVFMYFLCAFLVANSSIRHHMNLVNTCCIVFGNELATNFAHLCS